MMDGLAFFFSGLLADSQGGVHTEHDEKKLPTLPHFIKAMIWPSRTII
jgi:hypothetical protein